jgi:FkbM family methyltransferase
MNIYRALRRGTLFKALAGHEPFMWVRRRPGIQEFGSKYGRWAIDATRMSESTVIASFGLGDDVSFEDEVIARFGCRVVGFDPTPRSLQYLAQRPPSPNFNSHAYALAANDGHMEFLAPPASVADQVSASAVATYEDASSDRFTVPCLTLSSALAHAATPEVDVLKLDVEGAEYEVLTQAARAGWLEPVSQLLVEFHHFLPGLHPRQTRDAIRMLQGLGFEVAWVGRTNHEYLFVRTTRGGAAP